METLIHSFENNTIVWLLISGGIGGLIGALIKFIFEQVLSIKLQNVRTAKNAIKKYKYPLLRAAYTLDRRIENMIKFVEKKWFNEKNDDYYRLSTLYIFGCYFAWCKILEDEAFLEYEASNRKARNFSIQFYRVFKGITGFYYFKDIENNEMPSIEDAVIPRFVLTAIGELMIKENKITKNELPTILNFIEFTQNYKTEEFQKWYSYLKNMLSKLEKSEENAQWNRLLIFAINLRVFVYFLDPRSRQTAPHKINYFKHLHPKIEALVRKELEESGYSCMIEKC